MATLTLLSPSMKARFSSFNITLPSVVPAPGSGPRVGGAQAGPQLANRPVAAFGTPGGNLPGIGAAAPAGRPTGTPMSFPPALFRAASNDKVDCDHQRDMHNELDKFFDGITQALIFALNMWKQQAKFSEVVINGPIATGRKVVGPPIDTWVTNAPPTAAMSGWSKGLREGVARGFGNRWKEYSENIMVPGLPWYPSFAAWPGPTAPPTPNIPWPLTSLPSPKLASLTPGELKAEMLRKAPNGTPYAEQVFTAVAESLGAGLTIWIASQIVMNAKGTGRVPIFAPPYVPVGPVVGGNITADSRPFAN